MGINSRQLILLSKIFHPQASAKICDAKEAAPVYLVYWHLVFVEMVKMELVPHKQTK